MEWTTFDLVELDDYLEDRPDGIKDREGIVKAADGGVASALHLLGIMLERAGMVPLAFEYYRKAAAAGHAPSGWNVASMIERTVRCLMTTPSYGNPEHVELLYSIAAVSGHADALARLKKLKG